MKKITSFSGERFPLEMHKVRIVQSLNLPNVQSRLNALQEAGHNTFLLNNRDVFLDMLTDSGVNAMSDRQQAAMMHADDSYAGSETFTRLEAKVGELFGFPHFLPAHQGRACEHMIAKTLVSPGSVVPMNVHFTTTKAHIVLAGGSVEELFCAAALDTSGNQPFKGDMDLDSLRSVIAKAGSANIAFVRMEAGGNLIGGQPFSLANLRGVRRICDDAGLLLVLDASLLADNLYFIKRDEAQCADMSIREITRAISDMCDIFYFSGRKLGHARGGGMCVRDESLFMKLRELIPLFEGFLTYGGMSVREMEAMAVGLEETMDEDFLAQGPQFIEFMVDELREQGVPVVSPPGGLGCHLDAGRFLPQIAQQHYPAGALASALFLASGVRGMERGTLSEQRNPDGSESFAPLELVRLALPRRVFTLSQVKYAVDRILWLHANRDLIGGLEFVEEPANLRFFFGRLRPVSDWPLRLAEKFASDFPGSL